MKSHIAYCSHCYSKTVHTLKVKNHLQRDVYTCAKCQNDTLKCRAVKCSEMAKGSLNKSLIEKLEKEGLLDLKGEMKKVLAGWNEEFCAQHDGTIPPFEKLELTLDDISSFKTIFNDKKTNYVKAGIYTSSTVATAVLAAATFFSGGAGAAPIAAALGKMGLLGTTASGTAIASLNGAALTSASLAAIGGSVATGTAVISAAGVALGGSLGAVVSHNYLKADKSFNIHKIEGSGENDDVITIFINGFTQENEITFQDWKKGHQEHFAHEVLQGVTWRSKTLLKIGGALGKGMTKQATKQAMLKAAQKGGKEATKKLGPLAPVLLLSDVVTNPWHTSMRYAENTGVLLADIIARCKGKKFRLVGHSLGCRVIFYALNSLSTKQEKFITDVILLGAAVSRKDDDKMWTAAANGIEGNIYNCFSRRDYVLKFLYRGANLGVSSPAGYHPIESSQNNIININCSDFVDSHMNWKSQYSRILGSIYSQPSTFNKVS